jgi:dihydrolipoamide dehydrogenase
MAKQEFDVAVLGGGPGGYAAALRAAMRGARVCCIEKGCLGGCCLNVGCIPTKAMLHASGLLWEVSEAGQLGLLCERPRVDGAAFMARVGKVVANLRKGVELLLKARKVTVFRGRGRLVLADTVAIQTDGGTEQVKAKSIIIATGSRPIRPTFLPWGGGRAMTTDDAAGATELPESVLIVGGGVIGCEFATIYSELGIPTTVVEMLDRLVATLDEEASEAVAKSLRKRGVSIFTDSKITGTMAGPSGLTAQLENGQTVQAACALAAVGRAPNVEDIGLETVGVELEGKVIRVDDRCRTSVPNIYAAGDAAETRQHAHLATRMGIIAADNATGYDARDARTVVPVGAYTHPEVAAVGLSELQARSAHPAVKVSRFPYSASGMAQACGATEGLVKIIGDSKLAEIYGAVVIGRHAADIIQEIVLAMRNELTVRELADTIHAHPTFIEAVHEAADAWLGLPLHGGG